MAANKRNPIQKAQDRLMIESLYLKGLTHREIAEKLSEARPYSLSHTQVHQDLKRILAEWVARRDRVLDEAVARELRKVDAVERTAWDAWERSCRPREIRTSEQYSDRDGSRTRAQIRREDCGGDPRFLQVVQWCISKRCEILGLNAPLVVQGEVSAVAKPNLKALSTDELHSLRNMLAKAGGTTANN